MKESLRHICDTNRVIVLSELFSGNKDCPALAIKFAYHIECSPYNPRFVNISSAGFFCCILRFQCQVFTGSQAANFARILTPMLLKKRQIEKKICGTVSTNAIL